MSDEKAPIAHRFRGFLPVVVDLETGGFNAQTDAILEIGAVIMQFDEKGTLRSGEQFSITLTLFLARTLSRRRSSSQGLRSTTRCAEQLARARHCEMYSASFGESSNAQAVTEPYSLAITLLLTLVF